MEYSHDIGISCPWDNLRMDETLIEDKISYVCPKCNLKLLFPSNSLMDRSMTIST